MTQSLVRCWLSTPKTQSCTKTIIAIAKHCCHQMSLWLLDQLELHLFREGLPPPSPGKKTVFELKSHYLLWKNFKNFKNPQVRLPDHSCTIYTTPEKKRKWITACIKISHNNFLLSCTSKSPSHYNEKLIIVVSRQSPSLCCLAT